MGTNYYLRGDQPSACKCCGHTPPREEVHVGKSSWGWKFLFKGNRDPEQGPLVTTEEEWWVEIQRRIQAGQQLRDEYGTVITLPELRALIEARRTDQDHLGFTFRDGGWQDAKGNDFLESEFS